MKKLTETIETELPHVSSLGDGTYRGKQSGYSFEYKGKKYKTSFGIRGINCPITIIVENGKDDWKY